MPPAEKPTAPVEQPTASPQRPAATHAAASAPETAAAVPVRFPSELTPQASGSTGEFETATRQLTLGEPPTSTEELLDAVMGLIPRFDFGEDAKYRLAGVGFSKFGHDEEKEEPIQRELFGSSSHSEDSH